MSDSDTSPNFGKYTKITVDTKGLIELMKDNPCLWNRFSDTYRDKHLKEKAWLEIYRAIEPNFEDLSPIKKNQLGNSITRKWYNVRDAYVKSRKPGVNRPYKYSSYLAFLDPIYLNTVERIYKREKVEESNDEQEQPSNWADEMFVEELDVQHDPTPAKVVKLDHSDREESIVSVLANLIEKEEDEDRAFFKSITPAVKQLSDQSKFEFKIQVMKLIKKLKKDDRTKVNSKTGRNNASDSDSD